MYDLVKQLKSDIDTKFNTIAAKVVALEKQISTVEVKLKQKTEKAKKSIEEELNTSFQMLEEGLKQKMSSLDKTNEAHNNLEQYTHKNSVRAFGVKESDDEATPESQAIYLIKEHLRIEINESEVESP